MGNSFGLSLALMYLVRTRANYLTFIIQEQFVQIKDSFHLLLSLQILRVLETESEFNKRKDKYTKCKHYIYSNIIQSMVLHLLLSRI